MTTWFTSDLHFHHKRITEFTARGNFTDAEHHTEWLIDLWNTQVKRTDTIWHLGDFSFSSKSNEVQDVVRKLHGNKMLIKGNHCDSKVMKSLVTSGLIHSFSDYAEIKIEGNKCVLFHYPITSWNKQGYGSYMLHGHCHGSLQDTGGKILDVGLDSAFGIFDKHKFFSEEDVVQYMLNREVKVNDHHKEQKELQ